MPKKQPLYAQIVNQLREQILSGALRPGDRLPSENEIAEHFDVSVITSKRALNELADESLVVRTKGKGSFVAGKDGNDILNSSRSSFKGVVGVIIPSICMPIESEMFYHIQSRMHDMRYQTLIRVTDDLMEKEVDAIRMFRIFGVRGMIIFPAMNENYNEEILRLSLERFPYVLVDRRLPNITSSYVVTDNEAGIREALGYLMNQQHQAIALITQRDTNSNVHERIQAYENALADRGRPIDRSLRFIKKMGASDLATKEALKSFFVAHPEITSAITVDTPLASLTYAALGELGRRVPHDIALVSFDDPRLPFVPYVRQDTRTIALKSVDILVNQMETGYKVLSEKVPVCFFADVTYPLPFGL